MTRVLTRLVGGAKLPLSVVEEGDAGDDEELPRKLEDVEVRVVGGG